MDIKKQDYVARVSNATPLQLIIITYDIMIEHIDHSLLNINDYSIVKDNVISTQKLLNDLITSLNIDISISKDLINIYMYLNKLLISCGVKLNMKNKHNQIKSMLTEVKEILSILLESWNSIEDNEDPILANSQQIFAGLTYQKNGKLTEYIDEDSTRSYKA